MTLVIVVPGLIVVSLKLFPHSGDLGFLDVLAGSYERLVRQRLAAYRGVANLNVHAVELSPTLTSLLRCCLAGFRTASIGVFGFTQ
ncbi:hypothetical protein R3P38DRAFT_2872989, partial [Favolaschia claudopus]